MSFQVGDRVIVLADYGGAVGIVEYAATIRKVIAESGALGGLFAVKYDDRNVNQRHGRQWVAGVDMRFQLSDAEVADQLAVAAAFTR